MTIQAMPTADLAAHVADLARQCRRERALGLQGRSGAWNYSLPRHQALYRTYLAAKAELAHRTT